MDGDYIARHEHEEFRRSIEAEQKRLEDENNRQNKRLEAIEKTQEQNSELIKSVERLAVNMEVMQKEQVSQGKRLATLENRDGEKWRDTIKMILSTVIGIVLGYLFKQFGIL